VASVKSSFIFFYKYIGYRMWIALMLSIMVGLLDGFGLAMFIPMLDLVSGSDVQIQTVNLGKLAFIMDFFRSLGMSLTLTALLLIMLFFFSFKGLLNFIMQYLSMQYRQLFIRKIRFQQISALAACNYEAYTSFDSGKVQSSMTGEVSKVVSAYTNFVKLLNQTIILIIYLILAFLASTQFAFIMLTGAFFINLAMQRFFKSTKQLSRKRTKLGHLFQLQLIQFVDKFKYLKATGLSIPYSKRLEEIANATERNNAQSGVIGIFINAIREPLVLSIVVVAILVQVRFLDANLSAVLLSLLLFYRALNAALVLQSAWNDFLGNAGSLENVQEFNATLEAARETSQGLLFSGFQNSIELQNIYFSYGNRLVLQNITLEIPKNEVVAFIGESGAGKTTLMNIICGLIKPSRGIVSIDKVPLSEYSITTYQRRIGYITQEPAIFNASIFDNVSFWDDPSVENREKCSHALALAHMSDYIISLPGGLDTLLGTNGINLSGGQKQRIAIARELYKDVDILCLDEATSSLDRESEAAIQENIKSLKGKYTLVIIAHRLSTIRMADTIYELSKGSLRNAGNYGEIITKEM
jgi:ABC-type multidrug transport system fused ATPase/permease subunit